MIETRYDAIDLARGIALLGVALVNVHAIAVGWNSHYALDLAAHWGDVAAEYIVATLFAHRSFSTLAFLFGAGIAMQWRRLQAAHVNAEDFNRAHARSVLRSRYVALLCLGVLNGILFWPGDIVSTYAIVALVFLWRWPKSEQRLLRLSTIYAVLAVLLYAIVLTALWFAPSGGAPSVEASSFAAPSVSAALTLHFEEFLMNGVVQLLLPEVWLAVCIGIWVEQAGAFGRWLRGETRPFAWFAAGLALFMIGTAFELVASTKGGWSYSGGGLHRSPWMVVGVPLAIVGSVFLWLAIAGAWKSGTLPMLRSFVLAAGRTPLTQFFGQSLIFAIVCNDSVIGWHGDLGRAGYSLIAVLTYFLLAGFGRAWLASGRARGPLEMVWMGFANRLARRA